MLIKRSILSLIATATLLFITSSGAYCQKSGKDMDVMTKINRYIERRTGIGFPPMGKWNDVRRREFDFNTMRRPALIYVGTRTCAPCNAEFPHVFEYAKSRPDLDFVYITSDDSAAILANHPELLRNRQNNFYAISIPEAYVKGYRISYGFPTKYFIEANNYTTHIWLGGFVERGGRIVDTINKYLPYQ
jgi:thiol-disulfide isomerase/thioredoxin